MSAKKTDSTSSSSLSRGSLYFGTAILFLILAAVTVYSRIEIGIWFGIKGLDVASQRLHAIPLTIGPWTAAEEKTLDQEGVVQLGIEGNYIYRIYENRLTNESVVFVLMVGSSGHLGTHTPETCFGGADFVKDSARQAIAFPVVSPGEQQVADDGFWKVMFRHRLNTNEGIVFYYSINPGDGWHASEDPRYDFARSRFVYKMQAQAYISARPAEGDVDTVHQFLQDALPVIRACLHPEEESSANTETPAAQ